MTLLLYFVALIAILLNLSIAVLQANLNAAMGWVCALIWMQAVNFITDSIEEYE